MKHSRCEALLGQLMRKVREMPPGGDLEHLLETEIAVLKQAVYEEAAAERQKPSDSAQESFSP